MLRSRLIPCLLVHNRGLVKTVGFAQPKYVGDPLNAVRIFNEKEVDELVVLDIDATRHGSAPDNKLIRSLAAECRMPLCYGGGVKTVRQAVEIIKMGVEKVAISSAAVETPALIGEIARYVGTQSVVAVLDVKPGRNGYEVWTHNGTRNTGRNVVDVVRQFEALGAGEITLNAIHRDGTMQGYDLELVRAIRREVSVPMTVIGGAGSIGHVQQLVNEFGVIGAAAGSLFVFKGVYRAVLINYPARAQKLDVTRQKASGAQ